MDEKNYYSTWFVFIVAIFITSLIAANIIGVKLVEISGQHSTTVPTFETKFKTSIGEVREIRVSAERSELDGTACVLAITQDI